jgi:hypothetical protein
MTERETRIDYMNESKTRFISRENPFLPVDRDTTVPVAQCNGLCHVTQSHVTIIINTKDKLDNPLQTNASPIKPVLHVHNFSNNSPFLPQTLLSPQRKGQIHQQSVFGLASCWLWFSSVGYRLCSKEAIYPAKSQSSCRHHSIFDVEEEEEEEEEDLFVFNDTIEGPRAPAVKTGRVTQA